MLVPFAAADSIGDRFLTLLSRVGAHPPYGTSLEDELLSLTQLIEVMKAPGLVASRADAIEVLRSAAGLHDLAAKVLSVEPLPEFATFVPHLALIGNSKAVTASIAQNARSGYADDTARKFAELYVGCLAAHIGTEVTLDSPTNAKGDNPDVMFTLEPSGAPKERWAIAIKTISSQQGQTIFDRIAEGAAQIDHPRCAADRGLVLINAKSALDHEALWASNFPDLPTATAALVAQLQNLIDNAAKDRLQSEWDALFGRRVERPILFMGQSLVCVPTPASQRTPTALKALVAYGANGVLDPVPRDLAFALNNFMQSIVMGIPGSSGQLPA